MLSIGQFGRICRYSIKISDHYSYRVEDFEKLTYMYLLEMLSYTQVTFSYCHNFMRAQLRKDALKAIFISPGSKR